MSPEDEQDDLDNEEEDSNCTMILHSRLIIEHPDGSEYIYKIHEGEGLAYYKDCTLDRLIKEGTIAGFREVSDTDLSKDDILLIPKYWDKIDFKNRMEWLESKGFLLCLDDTAKKGVNDILKFILRASLENNVEPSQVVDILDGMQEIGFLIEESINDDKESKLVIHELEPIEFRGEKFWGRKDIYDALKMTEPVKRKPKDTFRKDLARAGRKDGFDRSGRKIE